MTVSGYTIRALCPETWEAFAQFAERHNGMGFGGCWCTWFHPRREALGCDVEGGRPFKEFLVQEGMAHAALVFDDDVVVAWCQYGPPEELPNIYHRMEYEAGLVSAPDYRLTCIFVDRSQRHRGLAGVAVEGAVALIAQAGGGVVEGYPHDTQGTQTRAAFLYGGTRSLFEKAGFTFEQAMGTRDCVMRRTVAPG